MDFPDFHSIAISEGLNIVPLAEGLERWKEQSRVAHYLPIDFGAAWVRYHSIFMAQLPGEYKNVTLVIVHNGRAVGLWPVGIRREDTGVLTLSTNSGPLQQPWFLEDLGTQVRHDLVKRCARTAMTFIARYGGPKGQDLFGPSPWAPGEGETWLRAWLEAGATTSNEFQLLVDLTLDLNDIRGHFRKSFRPLITKARQFWAVHVHQGEEGTDQAMREFQALHRFVSGRITRTDETWRSQTQAILDQEAFLITLRDEGARLVGAGLFHCTQSEGLYAVAAYNRDLFDKPIGHLVQMTAIETLKARGAKWYRLGQRQYPGDIEPVSPKVLNIGHFKEGFATHMMARIMVNWSKENGSMGAP